MFPAVYAAGLFLKGIIMFELCKLVKAVIEDVPHLTSNLANASAVIYSELDNINWAGFYVMEEGKLVLGPFQGKVACIEIEVGKGVCGTAVLRDETIVVKDVHEFAGHIACDKESESEIVIPIHKDGKVWGVLDIDSPVQNRFSDSDRDSLEKVVEVLEEELAKF